MYDVISPYLLCIIHVSRKLDFQLNGYFVSVALLGTQTVCLTKVVAWKLILALLIRAIGTQRDVTCKKEIPEGGCIQNLRFYLQGCLPQHCTLVVNTYALIIPKV
jgi:hypothetical protein